MPGLSAPAPPLGLTIAAGLAGAVRLGRGRADGLLLIEAGGLGSRHSGAARSFWAAAICLPAFLALRLLTWALIGGPAGGLGRALLAELLGFVCAWAGFALASRVLAEAAGKLPLWPRFIAAWNWANVIQYAALLVATLPGALGLPDLVANGLALAGLGYAVWLEWFVTSKALQVGGGRAAGFVALDLAIGVFLGGLVARISAG